MAALTLCATGCAPSDPAGEAFQSNLQPIVGGTATAWCKLPPTVALLDASNDPTCTGTLVAPTVVVTAAHCLVEGWDNTPVAPKQVKVVYGHDDARSVAASERRTVTKVIPHPDYDGHANSSSPYGLGLAHDIGVLLLAEPIQNAVTAAILEPSLAETELAASVDLDIAGYGARGEEWDAPYGELYAAVVKMIARSSTEFVAGVTGADTCWGDSGGPVYLRRNGELYAVGATSRAAYNATTGCGDKTLYTYLPYYLDWVGKVSGVALPTSGAVSVCDAPDGGSGGAGGAGGAGSAGNGGDGGAGDGGDGGESGGAGAAGMAGAGGTAGSAGGSSAMGGAAGEPGNGIAGGAGVDGDAAGATPASDGGGCGCSLPRSVPRSGTPLALLLALCGVVRTRRRGRSHWALGGNK